MMQTAEASAAKAQDVLKAFKLEIPSMTTSVSESPSPTYLDTAGLEGAKTRRSTIMKNKRQYRYKEIISNGDEFEDCAPTVATSTTLSTPTNASETAKTGTAEPATEKKLDKYGFITNMDRNGTVYDDVMTPEIIPSFAESKLNASREQKWNAMMQNWDASLRRRTQLSRRLRKGVPNALRGSVWALLGNVPKMISANPGKYETMVQQSLEASASTIIPTDSNDMINSGKKIDMSRLALAHSKSFRATQETIERDIHRTYPRHGMFHEDDIKEEDDEEALEHLADDVESIIAELQGEHPKVKELLAATGGQASLRRVLRAYSVHDRDVGYCQGMNFIAGMFLTFMTEEEAFWLLVAVMNDKPCLMRGLFGEGMHETHQVLFIAEKLTHQFLPKLAKHLEKEGIHITMYATQWLLTLFTSSFEFDLVTRVWDCFLLEGWKPVYRVMLALMQHSQSALMALSFEDILAFFRELPDLVNGNQIMDIALKIPLRRRHLENYEKEFTSR